MRKAELSFTFIIGGVIALIVLFLAIYFFTNGISGPNTTISACATSGGTCVAKNACSGITIDQKCADEKTPVCCVRPPS